MRTFCFIALIFASTAALLGETIHRVQKGETLTVIARKNGVSVSALAARNHLRGADSLLIGQRLVIPGSEKESPKSESEYLVKPGDSLALIAKRFEVSTAALAQQNHIQDSDEIKVGQRLEIPSGARAGSSALTPELKRKLDGIAVTPKRWTRIVIHHSGTSLDTVRSMDRYHHIERHMENGLAYHFVIGNGVNTKDGEIYIGPRWTKQLNGGHLRSEFQNRTSIGICLVGDFNKRAPTDRQIQAVRALTAYLMDRCNVSKSSVQTHRQVNVRPTQCPGSKFPTLKFLATLP